MRIVVLIKQVPDAAKVDIDPVTGNLRRESADTKINPYDLHALETALTIKEKVEGEIIVMSMGPPQAEKALKEALMLGGDRAILLSDRAFAGSDVLATSYTLSQGLTKLSEYDLIICGKQTTDGDTAQVGPAIAEHLNLPQATWVTKVLAVDQNSITVRQDFGETLLDVKLDFPCLLSIEKSEEVPRLPSYSRKKQLAQEKIMVLSLADLPDQDPEKYGTIGSATRVQRIFPPQINTEKIVLEGTAAELTTEIIKILKEKKLGGQSN